MPPEELGEGGLDALLSVGRESFGGGIAKGNQTLTKRDQRLQRGAALGALREMQLDVAFYETRESLIGARGEQRFHVPARAHLYYLFHGKPPLGCGTGEQCLVENLAGAKQP